LEPAIVPGRHTRMRVVNDRYPSRLAGETGKKLEQRRIELLQG